MEGDGEGLVAIVQGLNPAGVTLTVCNRSRHTTERRRSPRPRIQVNANAVLATDQRSNTLPESSAPLANQRSSVQTCTGADFSRQHTSSQICDGRYASSYKLAHCMVTPTSPPEAVSEFPPQRKEPCRNQGNFEIGGHGSGQWNCHGSGHSSGKVRVSTSTVRRYGESQTWVEKGSSHRYCKSSRDTEAFAHSLRKYPSMAPFRTASTDLIEKLIRYTQAKNFQEMSRSTKSMRSLRHQKSSDTYEMGQTSKHQQTYTRTRQDDNGINNSKVQVGSRGRTRSFKLYSPVSYSRNLKATRQRDTKFSSSYDYLKAANSPYGRSNRSDESPSPEESSSPERSRSPEKSRSPEECKSPEVSRSPVRFKSIDGLRSPYRPIRSDRPIRFERSVRDLSLSDMSKYIRSTIRQICNERPVVFQVCPKLRNRFNQHKKVCPHRSDRASDIVEDEPEEDQASSSVLSRFIQSFSGWTVPSTEQTGCQCNRTDCHCTKATQCVNNPDASTNTTTCSCKIPKKTGCCRGMPCVCANKAQDQAYYNKRIDEEISEWLKDVPVQGIECSNSQKRRETVIKEIRKTLKQLPSDENFDDNARNEIKSFVDNFPLWNPGKNKKDEKLFKSQFADKLTERIVGIPRKPDRFRDIVKKWVVNIDFEDDGEDVGKESIIDKFVNKLKSLAAERPACDIKYTNTLRKEIIELLVELSSKFDGDMIKLKNIANKLATEIVSIPRNVSLPGDTTDLTDEFEENVSDWICEHGLCGELNKDPKLIEDLAKKLNKLKSHGINDECVVEKMKEEIHQFVDDVGIAIETMDELVDELMKELSSTVQTNEDELTEEVMDWLRNLPGGSDLHPRKFEKIINELVNVIKEGKEQGNEDLTNDILNCVVNADLPIDPDDLGTHVEELMEKLNILPSAEYRREQAKKGMLKDIFGVIENMSISEDKKAELREKAHKIVEKQLNESSLYSLGTHDDVEETIMDNMDVFISSIDIPKESLFKLKTSLSNTLNNILDESLTGLKRLSRDVSNLKQRIANDVRNAVMELPIDTNKKKCLIQQVKGTLSKNMHKTFPSNVKNTINNEIGDVVDRCPISEDNSIGGCLKKMLSAVASKHLNICLPKCVCDIQSTVEKDVGIVIDRSSIDTGKKKELKKKIQDILTENEDRLLSDELLTTIKTDVNGVVSDLSIPQDKKDVLKKIVGETISKDFSEALSNFRQDLNKIRNKLFEDICNVIEKSPIPEVVKTHLINNLKSVLARNLDSSLSDEEKNTLLDEVSNIVKDDMPEERRRSLTNKLAKKKDTQQTREDTKEIDQLTKNLKELENKILDYILREMEQAVEEAPIPRERKIYLKKKLKDMATIDYKKPAEDIAEAVMSGINEILDELHLPKDKKNELKNELAAAIDEYSKLLRKTQDLETEHGEHKKPIAEFDETKAKESILKGIEDIITESAIPEEKKKGLKSILKKMAVDNLKKPFSDDVQDAIKFDIADMLDEQQIPKSEKDKLKRALINVAEKNLAKLREANQPVEEVDETEAKESILQGIEDIITESAIPEEKKEELKRKLEKMAVDHLKKPISDDVQDAIKFGIADTLDEQQIPIPEKNKLKRALINMADKNLTNLRDVDKIKATESILQGIEKIIKESAIPEDKQMELKRKLKKIATDNLQKPFSDNLQDPIKTGIAGILDELQIPKSEKDKLKHALINVADKNLAKLGEAKQPVEEVDETEAKESILQGIEDIITESAIPEEKKKELKRKLEKMAVDHLKKPISDDVKDAIKFGIADTLDEQQIPIPEKNKLKRALINMADKNLANLRGVDKTKATESILQGIEKIIKESAIPEGKKMELKRKLKKMAADNLKKLFSDDLQDPIKIGIGGILDELQIPKSEKDKLKRALVNVADKNLANLREAKQPIAEFDETKAKESILQGIEDIITESAIPEEKKKGLKSILKKIAVDNLKKPFGDDVQDAIKFDIADMLDEQQIPKSEKDKLKRALINVTEKNLAKLREAKQPVEEVDETEAKESIFQGIEDIITESAIPEEKKKELKKKLEKMAVDHLNKPISDDVQDAIKFGIADTLDEQQIPITEKNKLKRALINMADENLAKVRDVDKTKAKESILQGIEKIIKESAIPEDKKMELKRKLKKMATDNLKKPFSDDLQDPIKTGIAGILDELQIPKSEKDELKRALLNVADKNLAKLQEAKQPVEEVDETEAKESILQGIEDIITESAIPEEKKKELKRKLEKMADDHLTKPISDDVQDAIKFGIAETLDEQQIPIPEKNKLKRALINMADKNLANLLDVDKTKATESILQGIEKIIKESAIPEDKKMELERKLKKIATDNLKKPFSDDLQDPIKTGIAVILDELQIPKSEKDKLKRALINVADKNFAKLGEAKQPDEEVDETEVKESILQGIEDIITESAIPEEKKKQLKRKLEKMAVDHLKKPISDDVQDAIKIDIADILDDLQIPKSEKHKLKRAFINMANENMPKLRKQKQSVEEVDETKAKENILHGIQDIITEAAIPEEKKKQLQRKLKKMATDNLKKPFTDDVQDAIKIDIADILDDLQIPKSEKDKLKRALINMADENLAKLREAKQSVEEIDETKAKESILQGIEDIITESAIPEEKKKGLKSILKKIAVDNLKKPFGDDVQDAFKIDIADTLDDLQMPRSESDKLKRALINMADKNLAKLREAKQPVEEINETKAKESILLGFEDIISESAIPEEKKKQLKRKMKKMATDNLEKPFSVDVQNAIKIGIADILDDLQMPKSEKDKLKRSLINMADENLAKLREAKQPIEEVDETKAKESILQGMEDIVTKSAIPEEKKKQLKRKLKKMATDNLKKPISDDVQDALKIDIADTLDDLQMPKSDTDKLKRALINMADENLAKLREAKQPVEVINETKAKESILLGIEDIISESVIPEEKKKQLKRKMKKMATDNLEKPFSVDVQDAIKIGIADILDDLQMPKSEKDKLKRSLINMADENLAKLREAKQPIEEVEETKAKESILLGIEDIISESAIPEEKKKQLKMKIKKMATDNLEKPFSVDVQDAIIIGIADVLDDLQMPKSEKDKLKRSLINMADENLAKLREAKQPVEEVQETKAKESILQGIDDIITESAIPEEKKKQLKRKLKKMATDNLKKPISDDVQDALKIDIADTLDDLQMPKSDTDKLKRALINMADENLAKLREVKQPVEVINETKAKESILLGIEDIISESVIPEEKKKQLKRKMKKMATDNLEKPFSVDVQDAIKIGIADILDDLQMPKSEKDKLKRSLINMADENLAKLREAKQPIEEVEETKAKESILQGIDDIITESAIPEEKKKQLKRKLKKMATDNLKKPISDDVQDALKIDIADTLDDLQMPKSDTDKLKRALINMADENLAKLREAKQPVEVINETKAKESILLGIEDIISESVIPEEKKKQLKRKMKKMATDNLEKPFSVDVQDAIKIGIADILDDLQMPKSEKDKLKRSLINMADENLAKLREAKQPIEEVEETKAKESILQGIDDIIRESAIPEEKKKQLKRKLKKMATDNLKKPISDDVQDALKIDIADTLDDLQMPKSDTDKLKRALINMADENLAKLREAKQPVEVINETKAKESILLGIEDIISESAIPEEKKKQLKRKMKKMATDNLEKPFSVDVQDAIKIGIADILDDLQMPKSEKDKLKRSLINMADENLAKLREEKQPVEEVEETKAKESILQGIDNIITESAIPEEKKKQLKRKLKKMATDNLKKPISDEVQVALKIDIADTLDDLQMPKSDTDKLKRALINMADENLAKLREAKQPVEEVGETKAKESILQGIDDIITESAIPEEKKKQLKRKMKKMATDNLEKPFSVDVQDAIKIGIADILDDLQMPKSEKDKLKRSLINMADENLAKLREEKQPVEEVEETKAKESILQGIDNIITESAIPEEKKKQLKRKLKKMATDNLKKPISDEVQVALKIDIADTLDDLQMPKSDTDKLKRALINMADENLAKLREAKQPVEEVGETKAKESILQGIDDIITESAIPEEKKKQLKRKLKKMATDNLKKPISDDVQDALKIDIADTLDDLQMPKSEKDKLKRALINMADENLAKLREEKQVKLSKAPMPIEEFDETNAKESILQGIEKIIEEAAIPENKQMELKRKFKKMADDTAAALKDDIYEILDELNLPKDKKNKLKSELTAAADEYSKLSNFKNEINLAKTMPDAKRNKLNVIIRRVLPQFDEAVDPSYQKQLAEEFDELLEIAGTDGDFKDARRKLIKKLMREQNLSEKEASGPVDELIGRAREMALKEDIGDERYELDPSYVKTLEADINGLVNIAQVGGDFEDARRKLKRKLMREQNLPEEKASAYADELIGKARKLALAAQSKDKSVLHKEALAKAISDAVDQSTLSKPDKNSLKNKLLSKLKQTMDHKRFINKDDLEPLKSGVLKDLKQIVDASSIPTEKKNELKSLLNEKLVNTIDHIMDEYDIEEGYTKAYTKAISKAVNKSPLHNLQKCNLKKALANVFDGAMDDDDDDKIIKDKESLLHKETLAKAINDAVDLSTLSKPDKSSLKNKLLKKMEQTVDESPHINDIGALKEEVFKDCKTLVDASSIPTGKKNELKLLLEEKIMDIYDDKAVNKSPEKLREDKLKKYKEAFGGAINDAVSQSTLSKPDKSSQKNKLLSFLNETIDNSPHLNDIVPLTDEVLKHSKKVVDTSSIPIDKKTELKLLLEEAMTETAKKIMNDEEVSGEAFAIYKDKLAETVKTWMDSLPIDLDPNDTTAVANDLASDILDRQKYLQLHPEAISTDKEEIENLKYQIFRKMKPLVDSKDMPPIMEGTEELYRMIMEIEPPPGFPKLRG